MKRVTICCAALVIVACAHTAAGPTPGVGTAEPGAAAQDRELFDIALRIARDPGAQAELAPHARVLYHGEQDIDEPLLNAEEALGWLAQARPVLVPHDAPSAQDAEQTYMRCSAAELRCDVEQPGGVTRLKFANEGAGAQRRIVLLTVESEAP